MIILVILLCLLGLTLISFKNKKNRNTLLSWRGNLIFSGIYLAVLLAAVPIFYALPKEGFSKLVNHNNQAQELAQNTLSALYNNHLPPGGNLDNHSGLYKNSSHTFSIDTNSIDTKKLIINEVPPAGSQPVFVTRKKVDDGKIEVSTYIAPQIDNTIDFTKLVLPPIITYQNGTLSLDAPHQSLNFIQFNPDFMVNQFKKQNPGRYANSYISLGQTIVYIRIPKSLEIGNDPNNGMNNGVNDVHIISS